MNLVPGSLRALVFFAFALNAADAAMWPLIPRLRDDFELSGAQVGLFFAAPTLVVLLAAVPVGQLGARVGSRRPLLVAGALLPVALGMMAIAHSLALLLAGRLVFGLAFAAFWSLGPALAASRVPGTRGSAIVMTAAGAGWLVAPLVAGGLDGVVGWRVVLLGGAVIATLVPIWFLRNTGDVRAARSVPLRETIELVRHSPEAAGAVATSALLGAVTGAVAVLVPSVLADNGVGSAGIGVVVAGSSAVWAAAAACSGGFGSRVSLRVIGLPAAALATAWLLPVMSDSNAAIVTFLVLAAVCRALLGALLYPLAARAAAGESGAAALSGVLNLAWAAPALLTPIAAGIALEHDATRLAFAAMCAVGAVVAASILVTGRRPATA